MAEIAAAQLRVYPPRGEFPATPVVTSMSVLDTQETQKVEKKIIGMTRGEMVWEGGRGNVRRQRHDARNAPP